jgi:hypothetical protein
MRKMTAVTGVAAVVAVSVLVLDPIGYLTGVDFEYGSAELCAAIEGTWTLTLHGNTDRVVRFRIAQAGRGEQHARSRSIVRSADACAHRTLVRSAETCFDETEMPLSITQVDGAAQIGGKLIAYRVGPKLHDMHSSYTSSGPS